MIAADPIYGGANVRTEPGGGIVLITLVNGSLVQVLPETQLVGTTTWVYIRVDNIEGWVLQTVLTPTTLVPTPVPTFTPTP